MWQKYMGETNFREHISLLAFMELVEAELGEERMLICTRENDSVKGSDGKMHETQVCHVCKPVVSV